MKIFQVIHQCFVTDHMESTTTLVEAEYAADALEIYNEEAKRRAHYPYMWDKQSLDSVSVWSQETLRRKA